MITQILADSSISISELKKNPMAAVESAEGFPIAVLNRNQPAFYCVPAEAYEALMDKLEDMELAELVRQREDEDTIKVSVHDL
ncbi:type II toxin-antitoxin system Phd/YefM family antitoxin [Reinekea sp.]|jgi:antitoxin StbD|uniref:type II toxin-antitoxin system Phd/YefM family antitoxin n=1 Tax=Reinekea sp. TaxID=1970455 RepID=UPI00398A4B9B